MHFEKPAGDGFPIRILQASTSLSFVAKNAPAPPSMQGERNKVLIGRDQGVEFASRANPASILHIFHFKNVRMYVHIHDWTSIIVDPATHIELREAAPGMKITAFQLHFKRIDRKMDELSTKTYHLCGHLPRIATLSTLSQR